MCRKGLSFDPITFGLVASNQINAAATLHPKHGYVIGLNVGLANQIFNAAYKLSPVPKDTHPFGTFSFAIAQIALSFIIEHEVAHILNGHLLPKFIVMLKTVEKFQTDYYLFLMVFRKQKL